MMYGFIIIMLIGVIMIIAASKMNDPFGSSDDRIDDEC